MYNKKHTIKEGGFAAIAAILSVLALILILSSAFLHTTLINARSLFGQIDSVQGLYASESGVEDAIHRIRSNLNIVSPTTITVGGATAQTTITTVGNTRTIVSDGSRNSATRKSEATLTLSASEVDFFYGVQVGEGGVEMGANSQITGSIYSNGHVVGATNARVTGDLWVAGGANPVLGTSWETQNTDLTFGTTVGSTLSTVDSTGDTGEYTSLALGSDGFGRISYMDNTNDDLRYARCTNADCSSSVLTAVETSGSIYEVTSLALDSNDYAHITYYHDGNDDQKYARCANADCTGPTLTVVESAGNVGDTSAVKLGSDGFARIAYFQDTDGDVKFARCTNADCTTRVVNMVDATGYSGEWLSLALGSNGNARISYYDATAGELKFARCLDADCATKNITVVDTAGDVGKYNSLALDNSNFGRISYFDETSDDLKFARCANEDCTSVTVTTVDSAGTQGHYTSLALGADGFARISYYNSSNGDLKFMRCTDADCTTPVITTVDNGSTVGKYSSLVLGADGFGRISYHDDSNGDLKFVRCIDADCTGPTQRADVAQSFQLAAQNTLRRASLYIKKVGTPSDISIRIMPDEGGRPDNSSGNTIATGTLSASAVTGSYGWVDVSFTTNPVLDANTTYWLMADTTLDANNYWIWGEDNTDAYAQGTGKHTTDWTAGGTWPIIGGDLNFRIWVGGSDTSITDVIVDGDVHANSIVTSSVCGDAYYQSIDASSLTFLNAPTGTCPSPTTNGTAYPGSADPPLSSMPISQANITLWRGDATAGGVIVGDYTVSTDVSLGPKEITGDLLMTANNKVLTITGTVWVRGNVDISNGSSVRCDAAYGANSCIVLADGSVHTSNNGAFSGSGSVGSYIMLLTTLECDGSAATSPGGQPCGHHNGAADVHNQAAGVIFYATDGLINLHNGADVAEATAYKLRLDNTATVTYEQGIANASFSSGPSAGWEIGNWKEIP